MTLAAAAAQEQPWWPDEQHAVNRNHCAPWLNNMDRHATKSDHEQVNIEEEERPLLTNFPALAKVFLVFFVYLSIE
jgi:hypothetical protein